MAVELGQNILAIFTRVLEITIVTLVASTTSHFRVLPITIARTFDAGVTTRLGPITTPFATFPMG
jgi:hypothetical protein